MVYQGSHGPAGLLATLTSRRWVRYAGQQVREVLLPHRCVGCGTPDSVVLSLRPPATLSALSLDLCTACYQALPVNQHACQHCGIPLPGTADSALICGQCQRRPPRFARTYSALRYEYPADHCLRALKFGQQLSQARVTAGVLAQYLLTQRDTAWPECIVPVPLHQARFQQRGYNQVLEIGKQLSRLLNLPLRTDLVTRVRATTEQVGLSRRERQRNLRNAFVVNEAPLPNHIAVLDDVITTGSTIGELSRILLKRARQQRQTLTIEAWSVARVSPHAK